MVSYSVIEAQIVFELLFALVTSQLAIISQSEEKIYLTRNLAVY